MLKLNDFDQSHQTAELVVDVVLPEKVTTLGVAYDRGRLSIMVNGKALYENNTGMSDFVIEIDQQGPVDPFQQQYQLAAQILVLQLCSVYDTRTSQVRIYEHFNAGDFDFDDGEGVTASFSIHQDVLDTARALWNDLCQDPLYPALTMEHLVAKRQSVYFPGLHNFF